MRRLPAGRWRSLLPAGLAALLILGVTGARASVASEPSTAQRAIQILEAANRARSLEAQEADRWMSERARAELVLETLRGQIEQLEKDIAGRRERLAKLSSAARQLRSGDARREVLDALQARAADRIKARLDALAMEAIAGAVPSAQGVGETSALGPFPAALSRLEAAERRSAEVSVELATGYLDDQPLSVELLRIGGVIGWWQSLDGERAGPARMRSGRLTLTTSSQPAAIEAILSACRIAKGRAPPALVHLPFGHARWSDEGAR